MKKKAFTLIEVMVVIIIAGILASIGIPSYQNFVETQKAKVCQTNLKTLEQALDIYAIDHDTMPASLSEIPNETIDKAFARILQEKGAWRIRLAYFVTDLMNHNNLLYAAPVTPFVKQLVRGNHRVLVCPKDYAVLEHGGVSYGINSALAKMKKEDYKKIASTAILLGDCNTPEFSSLSQLSNRHIYRKNVAQQQNYAITISKDGQIYLVSGTLLSASQSAPLSFSNIVRALTSSTSFQTDKDVNALIDVEGEEGAAFAGGSTSGSEAASAGGSNATFTGGSAGVANITYSTDVEEGSAAASGSKEILQGGSSEGEGTCWCRDNTGKFYQTSCPCPGFTAGGAESQPQDASQ